MQSTLLSILVNWNVWKLIWNIGDGQRSLFLIKNCKLNNINIHIKYFLSQDWTLQIKFVQLRDAGMYEWYEIKYKYQTCSLILCSYTPFSQVSTHPIQSIFLHLNVVGELVVKFKLFVEKNILLEFFFKNIFPLSKIAKKYLNSIECWKLLNYIVCVRKTLFFLYTETWRKEMSLLRL